jgi:small basic protein (TIGR04137 family)
MSIDRSLKVKGALVRHRNVLTRAERVEKLKDQEKWTDGQSVFGLPKIVHRKSHAGKKAAAPKEAAAVAGVAGVPAEAEAPKPTEKTAKVPEKKAKPAEKTKPAEKAGKKKES